MKEVETSPIKDKNSLLSKASKLERLALHLEIARINGSKISLYWWLEMARSVDNERTNKIFNTKTKLD